MLPTSGYFRGIPCPDHRRNECVRPYCHFHHGSVKERPTSAAASLSSSTKSSFSKHDVDMRQMNISTKLNLSSVASCSSPAVEEEEEAGKRVTAREESAAAAGHPVSHSGVDEAVMDESAMSDSSLVEGESAGMDLGQLKSAAVVQGQLGSAAHRQEATTTESAPAGVTPHSAVVGGQSDLLQQLVSEAVKKVLQENPTLACTMDPSLVMKNIDTSALLAQAATSTSANTTSALLTQAATNTTNTPMATASDPKRNPKKVYLRPPDTPSYNPTPIRELNKRKLSSDAGNGGSVDSDDSSDTRPDCKVAKYTPTPISSIPGTSAADPTVSEKNKQTALQPESDVTDFSSDGSDSEQRNCDFDLLEEVLAEHSQNNKVKVKKKRVKQLGKLKYHLSVVREQKVERSELIADAKNLPDLDLGVSVGGPDDLVAAAPEHPQIRNSWSKSKNEPPDSHSLGQTAHKLKLFGDANVNKPSDDASEVGSRETTPPPQVEDSYFLPPSPVFTSSSGGNELYNSVVYAKSTSSGVGSREDSTSDSSSTHVVDRTVQKNISKESSNTSNTTKKKEDLSGNNTNKKKDLSSNNTKKDDLSSNNTGMRDHLNSDNTGNTTTSDLDTRKKSPSLDKSFEHTDKRPLSADTKVKSKGHTHLPQVVQALGAATKLSRPNLRNWMPGVRSGASSDCIRKEESPIDEIFLQLMDGGGSDDTKKSEDNERKINSPSRKSYKVDLDKEIQSLTNLPSSAATPNSNSSGKVTATATKRTTAETNYESVGDSEEKKKKCDDKSPTWDESEQRRRGGKVRHKEDQSTSHSEEEEEDNEERICRVKEDEERKRRVEDENEERKQRERRGDSHKKYKRRDKSGSGSEEEEDLLCTEDSDHGKREKTRKKVNKGRKRHRSSSEEESDGNCSRHRSSSKRHRRRKSRGNKKRRKHSRRASRKKHHRRRRDNTSTTEEEDEEEEEEEEEEEAKVVRGSDDVNSDASGRQTDTGRKSSRPKKRTKKKRKKKHRHHRDLDGDDSDNNDDVDGDDIDIDNNKLSRRKLRRKDGRHCKGSEADGSDDGGHRDSDDESDSKSNDEDNSPTDKKSPARCNKKKRRRKSSKHRSKDSSHMDTSDDDDVDDDGAEKRAVNKHHKSRHRQKSSKHKRRRTKRKHDSSGSSTSSSGSSTSSSGSRSSSSNRSESRDRDRQTSGDGGSDASDRERRRKTGESEGRREKGSGNKEERERDRRDSSSKGSRERDSLSKGSRERESKERARRDSSIKSSRERESKGSGERDRRERESKESRDRQRDSLSKGSRERDRQDGLSSKGSRDRDKRERSGSMTLKEGNKCNRTTGNNNSGKSIPMPVDPAAIKQERCTLVPDLSIVKTEKPDTEEGRDGGKRRGEKQREEEEEERSSGGKRRGETRREPQGDRAERSTACGDKNEKPGVVEKMRESDDRREERGGGRNTSERSTERNYTSIHSSSSSNSSRGESSRSKHVNIGSKHVHTGSKHVRTGTVSSVLDLSGADRSRQASTSAANTSPLECQSLNAESSHPRRTKSTDSCFSDDQQHSRLSSTDSRQHSDNDEQESATEESSGVGADCAIGKASTTDTQPKRRSMFDEILATMQQSQQQQQDQERKKAPAALSIFDSAHTDTAIKEDSSGRKGSDKSREFSVFDVTNPKEDLNMRKRSETTRRSSATTRKSPHHHHRSRVSTESRHSGHESEDESTGDHIGGTNTSPEPQATHNKPSVFDEILASMQPKKPQQRPQKKTLTEISMFDTLKDSSSVRSGKPKKSSSSSATNTYSSCLAAKRRRRQRDSDSLDSMSSPGGDAADTVGVSSSSGFNPSRTHGIASDLHLSRLGSDGGESGLSAWSSQHSQQHMGGSAHTRTHTSTSTSKHQHKHSHRSNTSSSSRRKDSSSSSRHTGRHSSSRRESSGGKDAKHAGSDRKHVETSRSTTVNTADGNDSPLPDLSELDEITHDDWEQIINSSNTPESLTKEEEGESDDGGGREDNFDPDADLDLDPEDPAVMDECLRMFNEFQPDPSRSGQTQVNARKGKSSGQGSSEYASGKKRVAHTPTSGGAAMGNLITKKPSHHYKSKRLTPMQIMISRYNDLQAKNAELEKRLNRPVTTSSSSSLCDSTQAVSSSTGSGSAVNASGGVSSSTQSPSAPPGKKRRISHVPNVSSLLNARERIKTLPPTSSRSLLSARVAKASGEIPRRTTSAPMPTTTAQTLAKGGKRVAHTPKTDVLTRPIIPAEFGSKVPQNIRQRYLNTIIDECLKFCSERDACSIGVAEERVCFQRASSRMVYLNLAVSAVKRLRTQQAVCDAAQELLDADPKLCEGLSKGDPNTSSSPQASTSNPPSSSTPKPSHHHPTNPNHVTLSHFSVLSGGGQKGSWSIEKPKKSASHSVGRLKDAELYKHLSKYLMTDEQLGDNGYPFPDPEEKGKAVVRQVNRRKKISPSVTERYCDRCSVLYSVDKWGFPLTTTPCAHHWGRAYKRRTFVGFESRYSCCDGDLESSGCSLATTHVSQNYNPKKLFGYVRTIPKDVSGTNPGVYALDCEMSYTTAGCELTRVTVINSENSVVYEQLVRPENPIIDYNTRFSGITEADMEDVHTSLTDVQASLMARFSDKTILIGHSLESDLHALKLIHETVVDTSIVFPHKMGPPSKRALRNLASEYLKRIIQDDVSGHDSAEDAITCMDLMHWRIKEDLKGYK